MGSLRHHPRSTGLRRILQSCCWLLLFLIPINCSQELTSDDCLSFGDDALSNGSYQKAIEHYKDGIESLTDDESLLTIISLETNLATALSSIGLNEEAVDHYRKAISTYAEEIDEIVDKETEQYAKEITSQASFFLGMVLQDLNESRKAVDAYGYTIVLDPNHWASLANLGSVLHDQLRLHDEALEAYNKAYEILTRTDVEPTDSPAEPRFVLSQLQYRIGLCLGHDLDRKCALTDDPDKPVSCKEMATHAFSLAVQYDSDNESAKHMLATLTADATMRRASNTYIKNLFDDYAQK
jgi:tetratricopeptide (TPR) repeat protein